MTEEKYYEKLGKSISSMGYHLQGMSVYLRKLDRDNLQHSRKMFESEIESSERYFDEFRKEIESALKYADGYAKMYPGRRELQYKTIPYLLKLRKAINQLDFSGERQKFKVPEQVTDGIIKETLEEATEDYQNECYDSTMVMCRRAYELMLRNLFINEERKKPVTLKNGNEYPMSLKELFEWFRDSHDDTDVVKLAGALVKQFGDEAAHVPKELLSPPVKSLMATSTLENTLLLVEKLTYAKG